MTRSSPIHSHIALSFPFLSGAERQLNLVEAGLRGCHEGRPLKAVAEELRIGVASQKLRRLFRAGLGLQCFRLLQDRRCVCCSRKALFGGLDSHRRAILEVALLWHIPRWVWVKSTPGE